MKRNQSDFINNLGIGTFTFMLILEFCGIVEDFFKNILIIAQSEPNLILWLPEIINLVLFSIILIWIINKYNRTIEIDTRKTLITLIIIYFGILLLTYLYSLFGTDYLLEKYPDEFDLYFNARKGSLDLQAFLAYIPILKYLIFAIILLTKGKQLIFSKNENGSTQ